MISSYKDLVVWQKSIELVSEIYKTTQLFPKEEMFSLTSQIRRAAISIPSNIAEGRGRSTRKDFVHFLYIAKGSLSELETQLFISKDLQLLPKENFDVLYQKTSEIGKLLHGIINKLKAEN